MPTARKSNRTTRYDRELSDKELNSIMRSMGDEVRIQSVRQKERLAAENEKEIKAARAAFANHVKNSSKT